MYAARWSFAAVVGVSVLAGSSAPPRALGATSGSVVVSAPGTVVPVPEVLHRYVRPGAERTTVLAGVLTPPMAGDPEAVVRAYLATDPEPTRGLPAEALRVVARHDAGDGWALRLRHVHAGLDVIGSTVSVRIDGAGRVRWVASSAATVPATLSTVAAVGTDVALYALADAVGLGALATGVDPGRAARLVVLAEPGRVPVLAYEVALPRDFVSMTTMRGYVDATTGVVLRAENLVAHDAAHLANVFEFNPLLSSDVTTVEPLASLPTGATSLVGPDVDVRNCIDEGTCVERTTWSGGTIEIHFCEVRPDAAANAAGDFLDVVRPATDLEPEDNFAEVQMYYHAAKVNDAFRTLSEDPAFALAGGPLVAVVNFRRPGGFSSSECTAGVPPAGDELELYDNAAFMPAGTLSGFPPDDWIVFGQGTTADFAYDGDVVYHEYTHATMYTVSGVAGVGAVPDAFGLDMSAGGLNEGYADYFSSAITGDPEVGEYAGAGLGGEAPSGAIRSLLNPYVCPDDLWGESHRDSEPFSAALWAARTAMAPGDRAEFDRAVYVAMAMLGDSANFEMASTMTLAEVATRLGMAQHDAALPAFETRGVLDCGARAIPMVSGSQKDMLVLSGGFGDVVIPAPVQFALDLPNGATEIEVRIGYAVSAGFGGGNGPDLQALLGEVNQPIGWLWSPTSAVHDAAAEADVLFGLNGVGTATFTGNFLPGVYHLQLANAGGTYYVVNILVSASGSPVLPGTDAGPPVGTDAGPPALADAGGPGSVGGGGCACSVGARSGSGSGAPPLGVAFALLAALGAAMAVTRRRRLARRAR